MVNPTKMMLHQLLKDHLEELLHYKNKTLSVI
jgi:hypothetical protein